MAYFTAPSAAEVRAESRLNPEEVGAWFANTAAIDADIRGRLSRKTLDVEEFIAGSITEDEWAAQSEAWQARASARAYDIVINETMCSFWRSLRDYEAAKAYCDEADAIRARLVLSLAEVSTTTADDSGMVLMSISLSESADGDEYSS